MSKTKYSFLEFDEKEIVKLGKRHCWPPIKIGDVFENGFHAGAYAQHSKDAAIMKQLIEIIELQEECIKHYSARTVWFKDGGELRHDSGPKMSFFEDEEWCESDAADSTLAEVEAKLKELK